MLMFSVVFLYCIVLCNDHRTNYYLYSLQVLTFLVIFGVSISITLMLFYYKNASVIVYCMLLVLAILFVDINDILLIVL